MIFHGIFFLDRVNASFNILVINLRNVRLGKIKNGKNKDWKKRTKMENYWEIRQKWKNTTISYGKNNNCLGMMKSKLIASDLYGSDADDSFFSKRESCN